MKNHDPVVAEVGAPVNRAPIDTGPLFVTTRCTLTRALKDTTMQQSILNRMLLGLLLSLLFSQPLFPQSNASPVEEALRAEDYGIAEEESTASVKEAELLGQQDPRLAVALENRGIVHMAAGKYRDARQDFQRAVEILKQANKVDSRELSLAFTNSGEAFQKLGLYSEARRAYNQAIAFEEKDPGNPHLGETLSDYGFLEFTLGHYQDADRLYQQAQPLIEKAYGPGHPNLAMLLDNRGTLSEACGDYRNAQMFLEAALTIRRNVAKPSPHDIGVSLCNLGGLYAYQKRFEEAERSYLQAAGMLKHAYGPDNFTLGVIHSNLADLYLSEGKDPLAAAEVNQALRILLKFDWGLQFASALNNLALIERRRDEFFSAELHYRQAIKITENSVGEAHPQVAICLTNLAGVYYAQNQDDEALPLLERALDIDTKSLGPDHAESLGVATKLVTVLRSVGKTRDAAKLEACIKAGAVCQYYVGLKSATH